MKNEKVNKKSFKLVIKRLNNKDLRKDSIKKFILCGAMMFSIILFTSCVYCATDPTLVTKINSALKKIQGYLVKFATPAAGVAIASGVLMRKFSFGNEEKMNIGKKVIVNAIIGYAIVLSIDLIIKFVDALI